MLKTDFLTSENYHILALAFTSKEEYIVITLDSYDPNPQKLKIPNICNVLNIKYKSLFQMLREEDACFVLDKKNDIT